MIDTHAHINDRFCDVSVEGVIEGIRKSELKAVLLAASNVEESKENIKIARVNKELLWASVGIHPQNTAPNINLNVNEQIILLESMVNTDKGLIKAVGECGLDYSPAPTGEKERNRDEQVELFRGQIELAKRYELPLIIHARKAIDEVIEILGEYKNLRGVFHCYTGGKKRINKVLSLGDDWYFGIDGNVTYEEGLELVAGEIPRGKLVLETDSPFLTPEPHRGEVNRPEYVEYVYGKIAEIWGISFESTEKIIDENAKKLFLI